MRTISPKNSFEFSTELFENVLPGEVIPVFSNEEKIRATISYWATLCEQLNAIEAMLKKLGLVYFLYIKRFSDGSQIELTTLQPWTERFYQEKLYCFTPFKNQRQFHENGIFLWSAYPCQILVKILKQDFGVDYGITFVYRYTDCNEFFHFASNHDSIGVLNLYTNCQDVLGKFILYFKDKFESLILKAQKKRLILPFIDKHKDQKELYNFQSIRKLFATALKFERYYIGESSSCYLTQREVECVKWYVSGKTAQETAMILSISPRTVEAHIEHVKIKLNCVKQSQLVFRLAKIYGLF